MRASAGRAKLSTPSDPVRVNTYAVALGVVLVAGVAFARVSLSAQITRDGYRLDSLRERHLELAEENRRLKMEQGKRQSVVRMLQAVDPDGSRFVRYDEERVIAVHSEPTLRPAESDDVASNVARYVADLTAAAQPQTRPGGQRAPEPVAVAHLGREVRR